MKIIQIINGLGNGGAEKFVVELCNQLSQEHKVLLYSFKAVEEQMVFPKLLNKNVDLNSFHKSKGFSPSVYIKLWKVFKAEKPDVVHFHLDSTINYVLPLAVFFPKIKFVHTIHNNLNIHKKKVFRHLARIPFIVRKISWVCIAPSIQADFASAYPSLTFHLVENGMAPFKTTALLEQVAKEISAMKPNGQTQILVSVAKLSDTKNQVMLMEVMKELKQKNVVAVIIGNDPSADQHYLKKITDMNPGNVHIVGPKSNVADYMACSDVFVITSLHEGLPISALEAFSTGLPVITTPAGGMVNLIDNGINGLVTKDFSKTGFLNAICHYLNLEEEKKKNMGEENRRKYEASYSMSTCVQNYETLYTAN